MNDSPHPRHLRKITSFALLLAGIGAGCSAPSVLENSTEEQLATSKAEWQQRYTWANGGPAKGLDWKCAEDQGSASILCMAGGTDMWTTASSVTGAPTYALRGSTYTQVATAATSPTGRRWFSLASYPSQSKVILFGGFRRPGVYCNDTWSWDGSAWREESPVHKPPPRQGATLVEDPATKHLLLFGGRDEGSTFRDLWEWDGVDWTEHSIQGEYPGSPEAANVGLLAVSVAPQQAVLTVDPYTGLGWRYGRGTFSKLAAVTPMWGSRASSAGTMAYDTVRNAVQVFLPSGALYEGRFDTAGSLVWTRPSVTGSIHAARITHSVYDSAARNAVVFSGSLAWDLKWSTVPNRPPVLRVSQRALQGFANDSMSFTANVVDPDDSAEALTVTVTRLPSGATWDAATRTFHWTPTPAQKGTYTVELVASDGAARTAPVSVRLEVLWHMYAMLPIGDVDLLTGGNFGDAFTRWNDPDRRILRGLFALPAIYEEKERDGYFHQRAFPWPYGAPLISCRFTGHNPGKVVASCIENNSGAQGNFTRWERPVAEGGDFPRGRLITVSGEGPAMVASGYQVYLNSSARITQSAAVTALLRPMPTH